MKFTQNNQRLQQTKYLGSNAKNRVELEEKQRVHRGFSATSNRETSEELTPQGGVRGRKIK